MQGRRIKDARPHHELEPGDYKKDPGSNDHWLICAPDGSFGTISGSIHSIIEHEDGAITVSPSIGIKMHPEDGFKWHGYLENGIWREC